MPDTSEPTVLPFWHLGWRFARCPICQFPFQSSTVDSRRRAEHVVTQVIGFLYGAGDNLYGFTGPIIPRRGILYSSAFKETQRATIKQFEGWMGASEPYTKAFGFHYDCYVLLRTIKRAASLKELNDSVWLLALSTLPSWPVWPAERETRTRRWAAQVFETRPSLEAQLAATHDADTDVSRLLGHLIKLPGELLKQIAVDVGPCAWARLAAVVHIAAFSDSFELLDVHSPIECPGNLFIRQLTYAGRRYISRISSSPFPNCEKAVQVSNEERLVVCYDELGVLDICSVSPSAAYATDCDGMTMLCEAAKREQTGLVEVFTATHKA